MAEHHGSHPRIIPRVHARARYLHHRARTRRREQSGARHSLLCVLASMTKSRARQLIVSSANVGWFLACLLRSLRVSRLRVCSEDLPRQAPTPIILFCLDGLLGCQPNFQCAFQLSPDQAAHQITSVVCSRCAPSTSVACGAVNYTGLPGDRLATASLSGCSSVSTITNQRFAVGLLVHHGFF